MNDCYCYLSTKKNIENRVTIPKVQMEAQKDPK